MRKWSVGLPTQIAALLVVAMMIAALVGNLLSEWIATTASTRPPVEIVSDAHAGGAGAPAADARAQAERSGIDVDDVVADASRAVRPIPGGALAASDPAYEARFDAAGFAVDGFEVSFAGLRRGDAAVDLTVGEWKAAGSAATRTVAPGVTERVTTRAGEVEWDVVLEGPIPGSGALVVDATVSGVVGTPVRVRSDDGPVLRFELRDGRSVRMGEQIVLDGHGTEIFRGLPTVRDGTLSLAIPASVLEGSLYPVTIDPTVSPERPLGSAAAPGDQTVPDVAFDGNNFLVVWSDSRAGANSDIYGARITPSGTVLDSSGIPISTASGVQSDPTVAFDGTNYLVAWSDGRSGTSYDVYSTRVTSGGSVLNPSGIAISTATDSQLAPAVAFGGNAFFVTWSDRRSGTSYDVYGARVGSNGLVLDPSGIVISSATNDQVDSALVFNGTTFLVVWTDSRSGSADVYGARVTVSVLDPTGIPISTAANGQSAPEVAFDGANHLVTWIDGRSGGSSDIYGSRVSPSGSVLNPSGIPISTSVGTQTTPSVGFDGTNYLVAWGDNRSGVGSDVYGARVTPGGTVLDPSGLAMSTSADFQQSPTVGFDGTNYMVAWSDRRSGTTFDVHAARVTPSGTVLDPAGVLVSTFARSAPAVAFDGTNYLVVWHDGRSGVSFDVYGARVTPAGTVLDPAGIPIAATSGVETAPAVAFDGTNYLVVWEDFTGAYRIGGGVRVSQAGTVLGAPFTFSHPYVGCIAPALAFDGTNYLVSYGIGSGSAPLIFANRITPAGVVLDTASGIGLAVAASQSVVATGEPAVAGRASGGFLVSWADRRSGTNNDVYARRVSGAGVVLDATTGIPIATGSADQITPASASNGTDYLVSWSETNPGNRDVRAKRVSASGVVLDSGSGIGVGTGPGDQEQPVVAFNGSYLLLWRDRLDINIAEADIRGGRVTTAGAAVDGAGFVVSDAPGIDGRPSVTRGSANTWGGAYERANDSFFRTVSPK